MSATLTRWTLTTAQLQAVAAHAHTATVPAALHLPRTGSRTDEELRDGGLLDDYGIVPELETVLRVLAAPDHEYSVLTVDTEGAGDRPQRALVAVAGGQAVMAEVRTGGTVRLAELPGNGIDSVAAALWSALGDRQAAAVIPWRTVLEDLGARLVGCHDRADVESALLASGCAEDQARTLAAALAAPQRAEIVARVRVDGITQTSIGAVAVFDGAAGRTVAVPDISTDGIAWTTLSGGTRRRLEQAIGQLLATVPDDAGP